MTCLGAIFAGGRARRFGGDKAAAELDGIALIDHVAAALRGQCAELVVVGRDWPGLFRVGDLPAPGLGPLGALAGALRHAAAQGHDAVLSSGCDLPDIPPDLAAMLSPGPSVIDGQPLLGLWPSTLAGDLLAYLDPGNDRAMRGWIAASGARRVDPGRAIANINTPADLAAYAALTASADRRSSR